MRTGVVIILLHLIFSLGAANTRNKRWLIYPQASPTRHQLIAGIGIPAELEEESVTMGYVFKAEFYLPFNASIWRTSPIVPEFRDKRSVKRNFYKNSSTKKTREDYFGNYRTEDPRWKIYDLLETFFENAGQNGQECLQLAICQISQVPFQKDESLFSDILHIFLTPSLSAQRKPEGWEENVYTQAEIFGKSGGVCEEKFQKCGILMLNIISLIYQQ